jgi:hypothetical protein
LGVIPADVVAEKSPIVDLLSHYGIEVSDTSDTQIRCPWHADTTPSARVYVASNVIVCFTCARRYNSLDVYMHFEGQRLHREVRLPEALQALSDRYSILTHTQSVEASYARVKSALRESPVDDRQALELQFIKMYQATPEWWANEHVLKQLMLLDAGMRPSVEWLTEVRKLL